MAKRGSRALGDTASKQTLQKDRPGRKTKISLRVPIALNGEVVVAMERDRYSGKKKSVWIEEALLGMARHDADLSESLVGDKAQGPNTKQLVVALSSDARKQLKDSIIRLRLQLPTIEGVQSLVIRCAMRFRIRHPECFTAKE